MYSVLKFGGSSVAGATQVSRVLDIVEAEARKGTVVLVASAISGCTDALLQLADGDTSPLEDLRQRHFAMVRRLFTGRERAALEDRLEQLFTQLQAAPDAEKVTYGEIFSTTILAAKLEMDGRPCKWLDSRKLIIKGNAAETYRRIREAVQGADIYVAPGFICGTADGGVTTLGRGGSDYSAALYAAALDAGSLQIWTDVPGIMTANPKQVPAARTIPEMSYQSALEMASHGAKVLYAPTVAPAMEKGIAIEIRNTFDPEGRHTVISAGAPFSAGIASRKQADVVEVCLVGNARLKEAQAALTQAGVGTLSACVTDGNTLLTLRPAVEVQALQALHRAFFENPALEEVGLFIAGYGAVGKALLEMLETTAGTVAERTGKQLKVLGVARSAAFRLHGGPWREGDFVAEVCRIAPRGSLFIDCTNSETLYRRYPELFRSGVGIVSSNRRSLAIPYVEYAALHASARENGVPFRYETTVGAALPMLDSISRGANSCDRILSIEAVVSCTLNQILSDYVPGECSFASLVRRAQQEGLTEPDPRQDLAGQDALRKLLILSREAGVRLEAADVHLEPLVPEALLSGSLDAFYQGLEALEPSFAQAFEAARARGCRRRFVALLEQTPDGYQASIRLQEVPKGHPAYHLRGTENAIIIRSALHPYPLLIQGPGEGAREAASSILNDILR